MKCSCEADISARYRFCPHCGRSTATAVAQSGTYKLRQSKLTHRLPQQGWSPPDNHRSGMTSPFKNTDRVPQLPPKYRAMLQTGTAPDRIIAKLCGQIVELRHLLGAVLARWPAALDHPAVEQAETFLRCHCAFCGEPIALTEDGKAPLCLNCHSA